MADYLIAGREHPPHLPGEPVYGSPPLWWAVPRLLARAAGIALAALVTAPLWVVLALGSLVGGYPPTVTRWRQAARYLSYIWARGLPSPGIAVMDRLWLSLSVARQMAIAPLNGLAWLLDQALYGRALAAVPVEAPVFMVSAARSGSTQLAQYIESDPEVVAPTSLQILFPYLWLWRLASRTVGRWIGPDRVRAIFQRAVPAEFLERHEADPYRTDTFDLCLYIHHLNRLAPRLGPHLIADEFVIVDGQPATGELWGVVLPELIEGVARKTLLFSGGGRRLMIKGHFLAAGDPLAARFPDARFVTMIRTPAKRVRSMINFIWCNPLESGIAKAPWPWLAEGIARAERAYNEAERAWFTRPDGPRRTVLRFADYVRDVEGTMRRVYTECLDAEALPESAPRSHLARKRHDYCVDRSLGQLGIDGAAYDAAQAAYVSWCEPTVQPAAPHRATADPPTGPMRAADFAALRETGQS